MRHISGTEKLALSASMSLKALTASRPLWRKRRRWVQPVSATRGRFSVLSGSEVQQWRGWVVQEGCPRQASRSCGSDGGLENPSVTSPGHYRSLPALFTGCSKPPAGSLRLSGAGEDVHSPRLSGRRSPAGSLPENLFVQSLPGWAGLPPLCAEK